jgi:hypothetical protein
MNRLNFTRNQIKMNPSFRIMMECRFLSGKGYALFATGEIKENSIIMVEQPVMTWEETSYNLVDQLTRLLQDKALMDSMREMSPIDFSFISSTRLNQLKQQLKHLQDSTGHDIDTIIRYYLILETNAFPSGICPKIARCNHSCIPNAKVEEDQDSNGEIFYKLIAARKIETNEEVVISYLETDIKWTRTMRQRHLYNQYYFDCSCDLCCLGEVFQCHSCDGQVGTVTGKCDKCNRSYSAKELRKIEEKIRKAVSDFNAKMKLDTKSQPKKSVAPAA